ncbi:MAG: adenylate/guanylate cyclase domain-containing protein [Rhodospirillaceae bacterium]|jgi:adenylate cyclase|nr:adenylate/guanylate cyclase domain-containing protein [Rhodospirillaceae bacterium]MBT6136491.1 adenylate/guanylate cyclase domain-containing protein [Rhodospirillaceae bacterium]
MKIEEFFNQPNIVDLSFFNFRNAITAAFFANDQLEILKVNDNFREFFPVLGNVTNARILDVLEQLGVDSGQIDTFLTDITETGSVLIPQVHITIDGQERVYSLLSTRTHDDTFSYLNGVQGQFVDRTEEWLLRREREELLEQKISDRELIEEKSQQLENLATRLAKYLSPQIYQTIFSQAQGQSSAHSRKNLTIFFSDIVEFTELSDVLETERLATVINSYLSEMASIALDCGGTIDKFVGDAVMIFFGDPETEGETEDALRCVEMALRMRARIAEMQKYWRKHGVSQGLRVRTGISTGYCTVGNFGSDQRLDYTVLGSPVNLAARLQEAADPDTILMDEATNNLVYGQVESKPFDRITPKGFSRAIDVFEVRDFKSHEHRSRRRQYSHTGKRVEVNVIDSSDIRAAIEELRRIQENFEQQFEAD